MSMLSTQVDNLRDMAERLDWELPETAMLLREAADTIWELRESVHRERAEADKLREERDTYRDLVGCMVHPDIPDQLAAENAKLRELVREVWFYAEQELVCDDNCPYGASCDWKDCVFTRRMHELGVEVDG